MNLHFSRWCVLMTLTNNIKTKNLICMQKVYIMHYNILNLCLRSSDMVYQHSYVHSHCYNSNLDIFE